jgi:hypothetical protein
MVCGFNLLISFFLFSFLCFYFLRWYSLLLLWWRLRNFFEFVLFELYIYVCIDCRFLGGIAMDVSIIHTYYPSVISLIGCVFSEVHGSSYSYSALFFSLEWTYETNLSWVNCTVDSCSGCSFSFFFLVFPFFFFF